MLATNEAVDKPVLRDIKVVLFVDDDGLLRRMFARALASVAPSTGKSKKPSTGKRQCD